SQNLFYGFASETAEYPGSSYNVIAVGGTNLTLNNDNSYASETGWGFGAPVTTVNPVLTPAASWTPIAGGFSGNASSAAGGSNATATWSTTVTAGEVGFQGGLEVSATWVPPASGGATNATYTITNTTTGTVLATVPVDQTQTPVGVASGSGIFQD